jgi:hypothetical protein
VSITSALAVGEIAMGLVESRDRGHAALDTAGLQFAVVGEHPEIASRNKNRNRRSDPVSVLWRWYFEATQ